MAKGKRFNVVREVNHERVLDMYSAKGRFVQRVHWEHRVEDEVKPGELVIESWTPPFYVSNNGSDANTGKSPSAPFLTVAKAMSDGGEIILFKRGDTFRESIVPKSGLSINKMALYGAYGVGVKPKFLGSITLNETNDWTEDTSNIWKTSALSPTDIGNLIFNNEESCGVKKSSAGDADKLVNGGLESWASATNLNNWNETIAGTSTINQDTAQAQIGTYCVRIDVDATNSAGNIRTTNAVVLGTGAASRLTFKWKAALGKTVIFYMADDASHVYLKSDGTWAVTYTENSLTGTGNWEQFTLDFTSHASYSNYLLRLGKGSAASSSIYFDNAHLYILGGLTSQGAFYYDPTGKILYLYSVSNPGTFYDNIECVGNTKGVTISNTSNVIIRNLDIRYFGAHGVAGSGSAVGENDNIIIEHCNFSYIGGAYLSGTSRYGNGVESWNWGSNWRVRYNTFDNIYDAAITTQGIGAGNVKTNQFFYCNIVNKCTYSYELWNRDNTSSMDNIRFENNVCLNAGGGWGQQRLESNVASHFKGYANTATSTNIFVRNNIFYESVVNCVYFYDAGFAGITFDYNVIYQASGTMIRINATNHSYTMAQFAAYQAAESLDAHSIAVDPLLVSVSDFHLQAGSPCINAGVDVGLTSDYEGNPIVGVPDIGAYEKQ